MIQAISLINTVSAASGGLYTTKIAKETTAATYGFVPNPVFIRASTKATGPVVSVVANDVVVTSELADTTLVACSHGSWKHGTKAFACYNISADGSDEYGVSDENVPAPDGKIYATAVLNKEFGSSETLKDLIHVAVALSEGAFKPTITRNDSIAEDERITEFLIGMMMSTSAEALASAANMEWVDSFGLEAPPDVAATQVADAGNAFFACAASATQIAEADGEVSETDFLGSAAVPVVAYEAFDAGQPVLVTLNKSSHMVMWIILGVIAVIIIIGIILYVYNMGSSGDSDSVGDSSP